MTRNFSNSSISYKDGIITSTLHGIFNESSVEEYKEQLFELVMGLNKKPFALLADISQVEGATPEACDIVKRLSLIHISEPTRPRLM